MKILLDENFPKSAVDVIEAAGHEAVQFSDVCEFGMDDEAVFDCPMKNRVFILRDYSCRAK